MGAALADEAKMPSISSTLIVKKRACFPVKVPLKAAFLPLGRARKRVALPYPKALEERLF
jgi:hypothetical protein